MPALAKLGFNAETGSPRICATPGTDRLQWGRGFEPADSHLAFVRWASQKTVYIPCMAPRNHADCTAILSGHSRTPLAQFGLTPKSKRGLAAREAVDPLDAL